MSAQGIPSVGLSELNYYASFTTPRCADRVAPIKRYGAESNSDGKNPYNGLKSRKICPIPNQDDLVEDEDNDKSELENPTEYPAAGNLSHKSNVNFIA